MAVSCTEFKGGHSEDGGGSWKKLGLVSRCKVGGAWGLLGRGDTEPPMFFPNGMHVLGGSGDKTLYSRVTKPVAGLPRLNQQGFSHFTESERDYAPCHGQ